MESTETKKHLTDICKQKLADLGLTDKSYADRLKDEISELAGKDKLDYYLKNAEEGWVYRNENNLLVPYLLGVCEEYDHCAPPSYEYGELPDIDIDYLPKVKEYVQKEYCPRVFGEDKVCNITTYTKFGIRSALIDMARVLGLDRGEILSLTTELGAKDDEGETLTWDKAIELYDDLRAYLENHPDLAAAAKHLLNRTRGMGVHASGLIIAGVPLNEFVPLVKPKQEGQVASAWVEGLSGTDLGAVGLIKFDFLGLEATQKIAEACHIASLCDGPAYEDADGEDAQGMDRISDLSRMIAVNRELGHKICAVDGQENWTDLSYLDDPEALGMAHRGDLRMVFQFDGSPGIRKLAKSGGVTCFDDLVAYTALFRPGPMKLGAHEQYCKRKRGEERYTIHPLLEDILGYTHGILIYQEQCMRLLNVVGRIPLKDCEAVRKAISKKNVEMFLGYKEQFIKNGQEVLGESQESVSHLWDLIEAFAGYGFNASHATAYTYNSSRMLWLKRHLPQGYYPSFLNNTHLAGPEDYRKMKEYLQVAGRNNVSCEPIKINKSRALFYCRNNTMHYPYGKIKGIGYDVATKIEQLQPYHDYQDFVQRFGTDAKPNQSLIALGAFEGDPLTLFEYFEKYKEWHKKHSEAQKRFEASNCKFNSEVERITGVNPGLALSESAIKQVHAEHPEDTTHYSRIRKMTKRFIRVVNNYRRRMDEAKPELATFCPTGEIQDAAMAALLKKGKEQAELVFLGFPWTHPVERAVGNSKHTFEDFDLGGMPVGPVEVLVNKVERRTSKKGTSFYTVEVEDATQRKKWITVWNNDYDQFKQELVAGNVVILRIKQPAPPFKSFTLADAPNRYRLPPKSQDHRVAVVLWRDE